MVAHLYAFGRDSHGDGHLCPLIVHSGSTYQLWRAEDSLATEAGRTLPK